MQRERNLAYIDLMSQIVTTAKLDRPKPGAASIHLGPTPLLS